MSTRIAAGSEVVHAVIYAAKSTEDEHGSNQSQLADIRAAIEQEGGRVIDGELADEVASGYSGSRGPELARAIELAKQAAAEHGKAELWAFDPDRLARGNGVEARHLGGLYFALLEVGVRLRAVNGDEDLSDPIRAVLRGERNYMDSAAKGAHVKRQLRQVVEQGKWRGGSLPDGYAVAYTEPDERGKTTPTYHRCEERGPIAQMVFDLAREGRSLRMIQLELSRRGYLTRPRRKGARPKPFDVGRISRMLSCPAYCGLQEYDGELYPLASDWPRFIEPEEWHQLARERQERAPHAAKRGRPPVGYLLHGLAVCGQCGGPMRAATERRTRRKDGVRPRYYVCQAHAHQHEDAPTYCAAGPFDAAEVEGLVAGGLDQLLADAGTWREGLLAGKRAERERLEHVAATARKDQQRHRRAEANAMEDYAELSDPELREVALAAAQLKRKRAKEAERALNAALDALSASEEGSEGDGQEGALDALHAVLRAHLADAKGDVRMVNATLAENFERFELSRVPGGAYRIVPVASAHLWQRRLEAAIAARESANEPLDPDEELAAVGTTRFRNSPAPARTRARDPGQAPPLARRPAQGWR